MTLIFKSQNNRKCRVVNSGRGFAAETVVAARSRGNSWLFYYLFHITLSLEYPSSISRPGERYYHLERQRKWSYHFDNALLLRSPTPSNTLLLLSNNISIALLQLCHYFLLQNGLCWEEEELYLKKKSLWR